MGQLPLHIHHLQLIASVLLLSAAAGAADASDHAGSNTTGDLAALLAFKSQLSDPLGILRDGWTRNKSFCSWVGVSCSRRHQQRVTAVSLPDMPLQGGLIPHLGNLSFLHVLNLTNTSLTGSIPDVLARLPRIRILDLGHNSLSGPVPPTIFNMSRLEILLLGTNNLTGPIPSNQSFNLPLLRKIALHRNKFTGHLPSGLEDCHNLEVISIGGNLFVDTVPTWLAKLPRLSFVSIGRNELVGSIPSVLGNLTMLSVLDISFCNLSGQIPVELGKLSQLTVLHLSYNQLTGSFPAFLGNLSDLQFLVLESNLLTATVPSTLGNIRSLFHLDIRMNHLQGNLDFLGSLCNCRQLQILAISTNSFTGSLPNYVGNLSQNLLEFTAIRNKLTGRFPATLSNLSDIRKISFSDNQLTGEIPESIMMLENLEALDLSENSMTGPIPAQSGMLKNIVVIALNDNKFSGSIPDGLVNITTIQYIFLSSNNLSSTIPSHLFHLDNLIELSLFHNTLTGALPSDLSHMQAIDKIDLSSNLFVGRLPSSFGQLVMLSYLNLSQNSFDDSIPDSFHHLTNLATLDLSYNNLSGGIPNYLANFTYLTDLNLSFNELQGQIPNGGVFSSLSLQSLIGNKGLCGAPRIGFSPCLDKSTHSQHFLRFILPAGIVAVGALAACVYLLDKRKKKKHQNVANSIHIADVIRHKLVSYHEIARATENFNESNLLGAGNFGKVFKAQLGDGLVVAVKVLNMHVERAMRSFDAECEVLRMARHRNLIRILNTCSNMDFRALLLQYMLNGSLESHLHGGIREPLGFIKRLDTMLGVAEAMEYLHHHHHQVVLHCDLKPSNVLFDEEMTSHVADFGIAKLLTGDDNSMISASMPGTIGYMAPELALMGKASRKSDVFSFGIMLLEVFTGKSPTGPMFIGEFSLRQWVSQAFPSMLMDVVDERFLQREDIDHRFHQQSSTTWSPASSSTRFDANLLVSIFELGLICSSESPEQRMTMNDVVLKLKDIKKDHFASELAREKASG
ncbi:probable LRR receptor-like serine/threonine-protein kinase At3g47570 [Triticum dicoccoides]|uniref:probable LRR receptor-like serine/threonine-protein kinase At3g47570 n=1 Tax=Triticum dicoccoides TaxID=85692 RepID=UPI0018916009|nr:probable LRR receptor-like serine/threonine-protein kinase At3g47570 [Triticum dicoccoides]